MRLRIFIILAFSGKEFGMALHLALDFGGLSFFELLSALMNEILMK